MSRSSALLLGIIVGWFVIRAFDEYAFNVAMDRELGRMLAEA